MKLGKLLSVGEIAEQPPAEEPQAVPAQHPVTKALARAGGEDGQGRPPALARAGR